MTVGMTEFIIACSKAGLTVVFGIGLLFITWFLVKHTVIRLSGVIDLLAQRVERLGDKIEKHEMEADMRSKFVREEHKQMIETLSRINGYKKE